MKPPQRLSAPARLPELELGSTGPSIDESIEKMLGERLRDAFAPILDEPIPARFIELLDQIARAKKQA